MQLLPTQAKSTHEQDKSMSKQEPEIIQRQVSEIKLESEIYQQKVAPSKCYLSGDGMWRATISKAASFTLHLVAEDGSPHVEPVPSGQISCQLSSAIGDRTKSVKPRLINRKRSLYEFTYTPVHTAHEATLSVSINGEKVAGSPCTVVLSAPIALHALESGPVEIIRALDSPYGIAVLSDRSRVITECEIKEHFVGVYDHEGVKSLSIGTKGAGPGEFNCPRGIAVDSLDNIFIADSGNHRIQKLSKVGDFVGSVGKEGKKELQFKHPLGVCIHQVSRKILIADTENHRIQVLNADMSFSHMFGKKGSSPGHLDYPSDLCVSLDDFVYIADTNNNRIQVFSMDGCYVRHFGQECLNKPLGIAIDCLDTVIVTSSRNHRVYIFDPRGNIVYILGKIGEFRGLKRSQSRALLSGAGPFEYNMPVGVAIDAGGYVYVIDKMNRRMKMYL